MSATRNSNNLIDLKGKPILAADLLQYQQGSVVSKTLIDKNVGTVTLFAFDEDQGLSEHTAPFDALVHIIDGEANVMISGKVNRIKKNEMIIMPANKPHSLKAIKKFILL